jgi:hypothetical protein
MVRPGPAHMLYNGATGSKGEDTSQTHTGIDVLVGTHLQPCGAAPNLPAALARPPNPPG